MKNLGQLLFYAFLLLTGNALGQGSLPALPMLSLEDTINKADSNSVHPVSILPMKDIEMFNLSHNLPALAGRTVGIYYTPDGGGFCDGTIFIRGFDRSNILTTLNGFTEGAPDEGNTAWYQYAGLEDFAREIRVERGIAGSHAISLPGGRIDLTTLTGEEYRELYGGFSYSTLSGYKGLIRYLSGPMKNGFAFACGLSINKGHTYIEASEINAYNFYGSLTKRFKNNHRIDVRVFVIPQDHWQNYYHPLGDSTYLEYGTDMNPGWGYYNGKPKTITKNASFRSMAQLIYTVPFSERSQLTIKGDFDYLKNTDTGPIDNVFGNPYYYTDDLCVDFDYIYAMNQSSFDTYTLPDGDSITGYRSWFPLVNDEQIGYKTGLSADWAYQVTSSFRIKTGGFFYYKKKSEYDEVADLLGGDFVFDIYGMPVDEGEKLFDNSVKQQEWGGLFAELGFNRSGFTITGAVCGNVQFQKAYNYKEYTPAEGQEVKQDPRFGLNAKVNASYDLPYNISIFLSGGYIFHQPAPISLLKESSIQGLTNEQHYAGELGVRYKNKGYYVSLSGYYSRWLDHNFQKWAFDPFTYSHSILGLPGVNSTHAGIELESELIVHPRVKISLNGYYGWWKYDNDLEATVTSSSGTPLYIYELYLNDLCIGGQPQTAAMLSVWYSPFKRTAVNLDFNVFDRMYAEYSIDRRDDETDRAQAYKVPGWCTLDLTIIHRFIFKKSFGLQLSGALTNILNTPYFTYAVDGWQGNHERNTSLFYHGPGRGFVVRVGLFL